MLRRIPGKKNTKRRRKVLTGYGDCFMLTSKHKAIEVRSTGERTYGKFPKKTLHASKPRDTMAPDMKNTETHFGIPRRSAESDAARSAPHREAAIAATRVTVFKLVSSAFHFVTLEGTRSAPLLVRKQSVSFPPEQTPGEFADWAETQFKLVLDREKPDRIAYKLTPNLRTLTQILRVYFGLAILNLVAVRSGIRIRHVVPQSCRPAAFGLPKAPRLTATLRDFSAGRQLPGIPTYEKQCLSRSWSSRR